MIMAGGALFHLKSATRSLVVACAKDPNHETNMVQLPDKTRNSKVLVLGGTGRVGGSTVIALSKLCPDLRIVVGGRNRYMYM
uniref:Saccharopine dehydrogenase NADP binding domain-containing protein n=1 Tax=Rhizophora mucronata TaxID=61149 RepID=A0A2P2LGA3_RHIMU